MAAAERLERWAGKRSADLDAEELERAKIAGYEPGLDGYMTCRDPRQMTVAELEAMGHVRLSAPSTIRCKVPRLCGQCA